MHAPVLKVIGMADIKKPRRQIKSPFGKNLTALLTDRGIRQNEAARLAGVSNSVLHQWLTGSNPLDLQAVLRLCRALGADFQELLTGERSAATQSLENAAIEELFHVEDAADFTGVFMVTAKRLRRKGSPSQK
jgi:transcriptional regulator with XRE-family HTH domain